MNLDEKTIFELIDKANKARECAFSPYSHFSVGAALLCKSGKIYTGCNIESEVFTPTICAERTAIFKAMSEGERDFVAIAILGGSSALSKVDEYCPPCGVCRQVLAEFCKADNFDVILYNGTEYKIFKLKDLLPERFTL